MRKAAILARKRIGEQLTDQAVCWIVHLKIEKVLQDHLAIEVPHNIILSLHSEQPTLLVMCNINNFIYYSSRLLHTHLSRYDKYIYSRYICFITV